MALEIEKLTVEIAGDTPREQLLILLERLGELRELVDVVVELLGIDPHGINRRTDGERLARAVGDGAAMRRDLDHAHRALVALLREKAVVDQLQLHRPGAEPYGTAHDEPEDHCRPPPVALELRAAFARPLLHGRTIRTSRVCGRLIESFAFATRSTKALEDQ